MVILSVEVMPDTVPVTVMSPLFSPVSMLSLIWETVLPVMLTTLPSPLPDGLEQAAKIRQIIIKMVKREKFLLLIIMEDGI